MRAASITFASFCLLMLAFCNSVLAQSTLNLAADHPLYEDLAHFRALGLWRGSLEFKPMTRGEICRAVEAIAAHEDELGGGDLPRLDRLQRFCEELGGDPRTSPWRRSPSPADSPGDSSRAADGPVSASSLTPRSYWEPGLAPQFFGGPVSIDSLSNLDRLWRQDGLLFLFLNAEIAGRLSAQLRFYEDFSQLSPQPGDGNWVDNLPPDARGILTDPRARLDRAVIGYSNSWLHLHLGREDRDWGQGRRGNLFLSQNPFPLDGFSLRFETKYVAGAALFAQSQRGPNPPSYIPGEPYDYENSVPGDAYVSVHRFELLPRGRFTFGLYEAVAYGGRGIDLGFANPVAFLLPMTQDLYDRSGVDDKKVFGLDARLELAPVTLYGEFLIDRIVTLDSADEGEDSQISSFAQMLGLRWANPLGLRGADLDLEYAHLDPQVYFHHDSDIRRALVTDDLMGDEGYQLGHWLGPNADNLFVDLGLPAFSPLPGVSRFHLLFEQNRWGLIEGERGIEMGFIGMEKKDKQWITGDVAVERIYALSWEFWGWPDPLPGILETNFTAARVVRSGAWDDSGWQLELRFNWAFFARLQDPG